jgi:hypothetical protein
MVVKRVTATYCPLSLETAEICYNLNYSTQMQNSAAAFRPVLYVEES